jgi:phage-related protein
MSARFAAANPDCASAITPQKIRFPTPQTPQGRGHAQPAAQKKVVDVIAILRYIRAWGWERNRMPVTAVVFFTEEDGSCPLLVWLDRLPAKVQDKCIIRIERLEEMGHELRRPAADFLRDGIYELRVSFQSVNYRMLYFFHRQTAVISHGLTKEKQVPDREIEMAIRHRKLFEKDPARYTYEEPDHE